MKKTLLSMIMVFVLLLQVTVIGMAANPTIELVANKVVDNKVKVDVVLNNNPGVIVMRLKLNYSTDALKLTEIADKSQLGEHTHTDNLNQKDIYLYWSNPTATEDYTFSGTVATLCFDVLDSAKSADVSISYDIDNYDIINFNLKKVDFKTSQIAIDLSGLVASNTDISSELQSNKANDLGIWFYIGVAVLVILIAIVVVMIYVKKRNEKDN